MRVFLRYSCNGRFARIAAVTITYNEDKHYLSLAAMQIVLPPELENLVQRQLASGKYQSALEVILAGIKLLEQQEDIYQGRLQELQQEAQVGWEAAERGELIDGATAITQIRANLHERYAADS